LKFRIVVLHPEENWWYWENCDWLCVQPFLREVLYVILFFVVWYFVFILFSFFSLVDLAGSLSPNFFFVSLLLFVWLESLFVSFATCSFAVFLLFFFFPFFPRVVLFKLFCFVTFFVFLSFFPLVFLFILTLLVVFRSLLLS